MGNLLHLFSELTLSGIIPFFAANGGNGDGGNASGGSRMSDFGGGNASNSNDFENAPDEVASVNEATTGMFDSKGLIKTKFFYQDLASKRISKARIKARYRKARHVEPRDLGIDEVLLKPSINQADRSNTMFQPHNSLQNHYKLGGAMDITYHFFAPLGMKAGANLHIDSIRATAGNNKRKVHTTTYNKVAADSSMKDISTGKFRAYLVNASFEKQLDRFVKKLKAHSSDRFARAETFNGIVMENTANELKVLIRDYLLETSLMFAFTHSFNVEMTVAPMLKGLFGKAGSLEDE